MSARKDRQRTKNRRKRGTAWYRRNFVDIKSLNFRVIGRSGSDFIVQHSDGTLSKYKTTVTGRLVPENPVAYYLQLGPPPKLEPGQLLRAAEQGIPFSELAKWAEEDSKNEAKGD